MNKPNYSKGWNLNSLYDCESFQFHHHIETIETMVTALKEELYSFHEPLESLKVESILRQIADIRVNLSQANSFTTCLLAQNPKDQKAMSHRGTISTINARFESIIKKFQSLILNTNEHLWQDILETEALNNHKFVLHEWRRKAEWFLSEKEERLVSELMVDGFHAWSQLYHSLIGTIKVKIKMEDKIRELSVGQTINLRSHPNEEIRKTAHQALECIWKEKEELFAHILNHIAGFRLQVYKHRELDNVLVEPLLENRLTEETLNAMWSAVSKYKKPFIQYLNEKAKIYGDKKMQSYNFWSPVGKSNEKIHYEAAVDFILEHFSSFGSELENFARQAFDNGWIEAEDRGNKSTAAFCANFPLSGESRVFMTYGESITNVLTLAHELGHAFHNYAMKSVDGLHRHYPLSIAETASTFSEQIILNAALERAESTEDKLFLLDEKLKRSVMNLMNIHSRFLFEKSFLEERKRGYVSSTRLNELMGEAIDEAYEESLDHASFHSWIWTPHYYITKSPFYNFPYTFGYLFSLCLFAKSRVRGEKFEKDFIMLLRDSGSMSVEDLVMKHLGEDITAEAFWENGLEICVKDVDEFLILMGVSPSFSASSPK